jgi:hypothetical protein
MASKIPHVLVISGLGLTALGVTLYVFQCRKEKQEQVAQQQQAQAQTQQGGPAQAKIPLTVFADEGVPREATRF